MQNFENYTDPLFKGGCSLEDHATQSPPSNYSQSSFLMTSQSAYSPEPQKLKTYVSEAIPKAMLPVSQSLEKQLYLKTPQGSADQKQSGLYTTPVQVKKEDPNQVVCNDEIQLLKQHLKQKYKNYSEQEIEEIIYKFINEYLLKMKSSTASIEAISDGQQNQQMLEIKDFDNQDVDGRSSLSSNLDWNDRLQLEKYCSKQKKIEKEEGFRPSQYFGAIDVEQLEDGIGDPKIDQLFSECFGIKPKPVKKKAKPPTTTSHQDTQKGVSQSSTTQAQTQGAQPKDNNNNLPLQNKITGNNNTIQNDQSCKIILNFYNLNSNIVKYSPKNNQLNQNQPPQLEDEQATVLTDKYNKMPMTQQNCQILHQEQQNKQQQQKVKSSHQDSLKKYMSPQEIQKLKHQKNNSKSIIDTENTFDAGFYKTADPRQQVNFKSSQTQMNSPQSTISGGSSSHQFSKHLQHLSSLIGSTNHNSSQSKESAKNQSLSHQSSLSNLNNSKGKHQNNYSLSKQTFKSILYKQQPPQHHSNMLSISSQGSTDNRPKQQVNKLSYMSSKQAQDYSQHQQQSSITNVNFNHVHNNSEVSLKIAPKPPHQTTQQVNAKNQRDSKGSQKDSLGKELTENDCSPKTSPQKTLLKMHSDSNPIIVKSFNQTGQNLKTQQPISNQTFQTTYSNTLSSSIDKGPHTQSTHSFRDQTRSGASTQRSNAASGKTIGRNNSQNFYKTTGIINNIQSFLVQTPDADSDFNKITATTSVQQFDTYGTSSPMGYQSKQVHMVNAKSYNKSSQRPQTTISGNFSMHTGMNQYLSNASSLSNTGQGKPPSKNLMKTTQLGFLSHNSSAKNLKLQAKNLTINVQTTQNSSRKHQVEAEIAEYPPQSSRNHQQKYQTKANSLSKERFQNPTKSIERLKKSNFNADQDLESIEKKRMMYKTQKQSFTQSSKNQSLATSGSQKTFTKQAVTRNHNNNGGALKGSSATMINDYLKGSSKTIENVGSNPVKQESFNRTIQRINKSLDKIKQIFMNNNSSTPKTQQIPQSTKNATGPSELIQQINSYKSFIKKAKPQDIVANSHQQQQIAQQYISKNKTMSQVAAPSKTSKDVMYAASNIDCNLQSKKSTESFKKYLSGTLSNQGSNGGYHSFK